MQSIFLIKTDTNSPKESLMIDVKKLGPLKKSLEEIYQQIDPDRSVEKEQKTNYSRSPRFFPVSISSQSDFSANPFNEITSDFAVHKISRI